MIHMRQMCMIMVETSSTFLNLLIGRFLLHSKITAKVKNNWNSSVNVMVMDASSYVWI